MKNKIHKLRLKSNALKILLVGFAVAASLVISAVPVLAAGGSDHVPQLDYHAVFKTHVPHIVANPHGNNGGGGGNGNGGGKGGGGSSGTFTGAAYTVGNVITATTSNPEAEEYIAVDPGNPSNLVAVVSDFSLRGGYNTTKYAVSYDGGSTWSDFFVPLNTNDFPVTSDGQSWEANSDPVVAIDNSGNVYIADLYFNGSNNANGVYVGHGTIGTLASTGIDATNNVANNLDPSTSNFEDKEWIAVDNSGTSTDGNVYVSWTHFVGNSDYIVLSRSTDHGSSWSDMLRISPSSQDGAVQGSQVAVGPSGEVYVAYEVFYVGGQRAQFLCKSSDGGQTFSSPVSITPLFSELKFNSTYRKGSFISLAVGPTGFVYGVYADQTKKSGADVEFIKSNAAGSTSFSSPVTINDVTSGQQFMPAVAVDAAGNVHASWFDTRNSSNTSSFDIYATYTTDGGTSFGQNARVTPSTMDAGNTSFIGDYAGIAASSGNAYPVWTYGLNGGILETATLTLPS